jgi:hypothetical protein
MLTLHIVEIRVGRGPTWYTNWKQRDAVKIYLFSFCHELLAHVFKVALFVKGMLDIVNI